MGDMETQLREFARKLGITAVGVVCADAWEAETQESGSFSPKDVWPPANSVIVLGIPVFPVEALPFADEFGSWDVRSGILDTAAYRLSLFLNSLGYPSVNIPADSSGAQGRERQTAPVFSHRRAGVLAGLVKAENPNSLLMASVLTGLELRDSKPD